MKGNHFQEYVYGTEMYCQKFGYNQKVRTQTVDASQDEIKAAEAMHKAMKQKMEEAAPTACGKRKYQPTATVTMATADEHATEEQACTNAEFETAVTVQHAQPTESDVSVTEQQS